VVIGTRIIQLIEEQPRDKAVAAVAAFLAEIRLALDA
jgi:tryptophan synthase alpha chain